MPITLDTIAPYPSKAGFDAAETDERQRYLNLAIARLSQYGITADDDLEPSDAAALASLVGRLWTNPTGDVDLSQFEQRTLSVPVRRGVAPIPIVEDGDEVLALSVGPPGPPGRPGDTGPQGDDGAKGDTGNGFLYRGPYDPNATYGAREVDGGIERDIVEFNNALWIAHEMAGEGVTGFEPGTTDQINGVVPWIQFLPPGQMGDRGAIGPPPLFRIVGSRIGVIGSDAQHPALFNGLALDITFADASEAAAADTAYPPLTTAFGPVSGDSSDAAVIASWGAANGAVRQVVFSGPLSVEASDGTNSRIAAYRVETRPVAEIRGRGVTYSGDSLIIPKVELDEEAEFELVTTGSEEIIRGGIAQNFSRIVEVNKEYFVNIFSNRVDDNIIFPLIADPVFVNQRFPHKIVDLDFFITLQRSSSDVYNFFFETANNTASIRDRKKFQLYRAVIRASQGPQGLPGANGRDGDKGDKGDNGKDGAATFTELTDTPASFGTAGQLAAVNTAADGLEFVDAPEGAATFLDLTDTPASFGTAGQVAAVNTAGDGLEFVDAAAGGGGTTLQTPVTTTTFERVPAEDFPFTSLMAVRSSASSRGYVDFEYTLKPDKRTSDVTEYFKVGRYLEYRRTVGIGRFNTYRPRIRSLVGPSFSRNEVSVNLTYDPVPPSSSRDAFPTSRTTRIRSLALFDGVDTVTLHDVTQIVGGDGIKLTLDQMTGILTVSEA